MRAKRLGASAFAMAIALGVAGNASAEPTTVDQCVGQIEAIQTALNAGGDCDGVVLVAGRKKDNTAQTCESLNSKLDDAVEKLQETKGPKDLEAIQKLQDFINTLSLKSAQGKILNVEGSDTTVATLIQSAEDAQVCIVDLPD